MTSPAMTSQEQELLTPPKRAYVLDLKVEADDLDSLVGYLRSFETDLYAGRISRGVSGGYSAGSVYSLTVNEGVTHETFIIALKAYLAKLDEAKVRASLSKGEK